MDNPSKIKKVPEGAYLKLEFGYDTNYILPYEEGIQILSYMKSALELHTPYNKEHKLTKMAGKLKIQIMDAESINNIIIEGDRKWKERQAKDLLEGKTNDPNA